MRYMIHGEVPPERGESLEANPDAMQAMLGSWKKANAKEMYFSLARRAFFFLVEAENEDAFFEPLHKTWVLLGSYPTVEAVANFEEFGGILQRIR